MGTFYDDAAPVARCFYWKGSAEVECLGTESDMLKAGVSHVGASPVLEVVHANLEQLNAIRAKALRGARHGR
jgi:hypothetical protein